LNESLFHWYETQLGDLYNSVLEDMRDLDKLQTVRTKIK